MIRRLVPTTIPLASTTNTSSPPMLSALAQPQVLRSSSSTAHRFCRAALLLALSALPLIAAAQAPVAAPAVAASAPPPAAAPASERSFMIGISPAACTLEEAGRLARPDQPDTSKLQQGGSLIEEDPGVFRCTVGVVPPLLPAAPFACRLTGFAQNGLDFFKGDPRQVRRSCWVRRLGDGSLEFNATGIAGDVCAFSCSGP